MLAFAALRRVRRLRVVRTFLDYVGPQKPWQYRVDCSHPRNASFSQFWDSRFDAAGFARGMRLAGWVVSIHGERWA